MKVSNLFNKKFRKKYNLKNKTIGVMGMAFKADTDDIRDSYH